MKGGKALKKKNLSLSQLIVILVSAVITLTIIIQLICISILFNMLNKQKQSAVESVVSQVGQLIDDTIATSSTLQDYVMHNAVIQDFLAESSSNIVSSLKLKISDDIMFLNRFFSDKITLAFIDNLENLHTLSNDINNAEQVQLKKIYSDYTKSYKTRETILFTLPSDTYQILYVCSLQPVTAISTKNVASETVGVSIVLNRINIYKTLNNMQYQSNAGLLLTNSDTNEEISFMEEVNKKGALTSSRRNIQGTQWDLSGTLIYENQDSFIYRIIIMILIELIILIVIMFILQFTVLNKFINTPIKKFVKFLDNFILHNVHERLSISSTKEFETLSNHINMMLDKSEDVSRRIVYTQQRLYETELCEKEAVFYALQNQINPHFLYNTLECISGMAISHNAYEITEIINSLSHIMRYALNNHEDITVGDEIHMLEKYLSILKVRFPEKFSVNLDFDDDIWDKKALRMLFQPIVENSIKHGFLSADKKYMLEILGESDGENLIFTFRDNGNGIPPRRLEELKAEINNCSKSPYTNRCVGIVNIHRRIQLRFGNEYGLKIDSVYGEYTCITVTLPIY